MITTKIPLTTICARLERAIHCDVGMKGLKILLDGWGLKRAKLGLVRINFYNRKKQFGQEYLSLMELYDFSLYAGYDLTRD